MDGSQERHPNANATQRARRRQLTRIDYYPSDCALALIKRRMGRCSPVNNYSGVLNTIVQEWAELVGSPPSPAEAPMSPERGPELFDAYARANDSGTPCPEFLQPIKGAVGDRKCGARTRTGHPCRAKALQGTGRCKWHGGCSTGPRTPEGRARALANLKQFQAQPSGY